MKKQVNLSSRTLNANGQSIIFAGLILISLYFNPRLQDPFNSPKMWLLVLIASASSGFVAVLRKDALKDSYALKIIILAFPISLLISLIFTDQKYIGFFGDVQRRNGFLTYFALYIVFLHAVFANWDNHIKKLQQTILFISGALIVYGTLQATGNDFIKWNNQYNSILLTLGNPNFSAALMAILGVFLFNCTFNSFSNVFNRISSFIMSIILFYLTVLTNARQGLIIFLFGASLCIVYQIYLINKRISRVISFFLGSLGILVVIGMLQIGPLAQIVYKDSVSVRGFYWRAAIKMLEHNPIFGVGLDRYGYYFKEFREKEYSLKYGYDISSSNAHNVPLQFLATGGLILGLSYLALVIFTFVCGVRNLKHLPKERTTSFVGIFSAWIAYQAQSFVSIDNIGLSIWGWVLSGIIISIAHTSSDKSQTSAKTKVNEIKSLVRPLISGTSIVASLIMCSLLLNSESNLFQMRSVFNPKIESSNIGIKELADRAISNPLIEPTNQIFVSSYLIESGYRAEGIKLIKQVIAKDSRNLDAINLAADFYQNSNQCNESLEYREQVKKLDPWNARNLYQSGRCYKFLDNQNMVEEIYSEIIMNFPNSEIKKLAEEEFGS